MSKQAIRDEMMKRRLSFSSRSADLRSKNVIDVLVSQIFFAKFHNILIYLPIKKEVNTKELIKKQANENKNLFLSAFLNGKWVISRYASWDKLEKVYGDVLQPCNLSVVDGSILDLAIIPGVAFSKNGTRLGFGLGAYDRLLANTRCVKIGLCYDFQIVDSLKRDLHDVLMDYIVCETACYKTSG